MSLLQTQLHDLQQKLEQALKEPVVDDAAVGDVLDEIHQFFSDDFLHAQKQDGLEHLSNFADWFSRRYVELKAEHDSVRKELMLLQSGKKMRKEYR